MPQPLGVILAGGHATRMGGVAKAGLMLGGMSLLNHCIERLDPQVAALAVNANDPVETDLAVLADGAPGDLGRLGPLAGVLAGLDWAQSGGASHIVSVAVDTPFFPCDLVARLIWAGETHPNGLACAATGQDHHGTFGIWPVALRDDLAAYLEDGGRKVRDFLDAQGAGKAEFKDAREFFNINTPADLAQAETWM